MRSFSISGCTHPPKPEALYETLHFASTMLLYASVIIYAHNLQISRETLKDSDYYLFIFKINCIIPFYGDQNLNYPNSLCA